MIHDTKRIRIRSHDTVRIHGFAKRIHVFTNLLYESRILSFKTIQGHVLHCFNYQNKNSSSEVSHHNQQQQQQQQQQQKKEGKTH